MANINSCEPLSHSRSFREGRHGLVRYVRRGLFIPTNHRLNLPTVAGHKVRSGKKIKEGRKSERKVRRDRAGTDGEFTGRTIGIQIVIEGCVSEMGLRKDLHSFHRLFAISTFCLKNKRMRKLFKSGETGWQSGHLREDKNSVDDMGRINSCSVY